MKMLKSRDIEKEVEKIIKLTFPRYYVDEDWNQTILDNADSLDEKFFEMVRCLVDKEKDKMLFDAVGYNYLKKKVFFDILYNFNDTLNKLKQSTIELVHILNEK